MVIEKYLGNGFLDLVEFISLMRKISKSIKSAFAEVDSNQDGKISVDEMKRVRSFFNRQLCNTSKRKWQQVLNAGDNGRMRQKRFHSFRRKLQ